MNEVRGIREILSGRWAGWGLVEDADLSAGAVGGEGQCGDGGYEKGPAHWRGLLVLVPGGA